MNNASTTFRKLSRRERSLAADRAARYREAHPERPDVRAVDKAVSEAVAVYALSLPPAEATAFLARIVELSAEGLRYRNFGVNASRNRVAARLATWTAPTPSSGSVKAAVRRRAVRDGITPADACTPVTSSFAITGTLDH